MRYLIACMTIVVSAAFASAEPVRVRVSFAEADEKQPADWVTRALTQSATDELSATGEVQIVPAGETQQQKPQFVVLGTIQRINSSLRVTGRVEDAAGKTVGGFKATGMERDLFAIEDKIAQQLKVALGLESHSLLEDAPVAARTSPPVRGSYEGSDLQRTLQERDRIRLENERGAVLTQSLTPTYVYPQQPTYPITYGINGIYSPPYYGYPGFYGYGFGGYGGNRVIIVNKNYRVGGNGSPVAPAPGPAPSHNGQRIREVSSWAGNPPPGVVNTPNSAPSLVPGGK